MNKPSERLPANIPTPVAPHTPTSSLDRLRQFVETHRKADPLTPQSFADFEAGVHERLMQVERDLVGEQLARYDLDAEAIEINGTVHRRTLRQSQTYMTAAGQVVVERWLYRDRADKKARCVSPMDLRVGIVGDFWTPRAAQQALWVVVQMTPKKGEELLERMGNMAPSQSSLQRLPGLIDKRWESDREQLEQALRDGLEVPEQAASVVVSLDGVLVPMDKEDLAPKDRRKAGRPSRSGKGPSGHREVGCGTVAFCDCNGELMRVVRMARAPESKKETLKQMLTAELGNVLKVRPDLRLVKLADAARDNWRFLSGPDLPPGYDLVDIFHASEHLHAALENAHGKGTHKTKSEHEGLHEVLRDDEMGVDKVIAELEELSQKYPRRKLIARELAFFKNNKDRMNYASVKAKGLMIGSGVVEAACKTLATQRLKQSGMRWSKSGAQAILTPRGWDQSERFDRAWALVAATFQAEVTVLANVVPLLQKVPRKPNLGEASQ